MVFQAPAKVPADMRALPAASRTFGAEQALRPGFVHEIAAPEAWSALVARPASEAQQLSPAATARLHAATVSDTRAADRADLVRSAIEPGLKERIGEYRKG